MDKPFTGFETIKDLPTGDVRPEHTVYMNESIEDGSVTVLLECNHTTIAKKTFERSVRMTPDEIELWIKTTFEAHDCVKEEHGV